MMSREPFMGTNDVLVFGLNPAYQSTLSFPNLVLGEVNRAQRKSNSIGGKGQNFSIACANYGKSEMITIAQIVGGSNGSRCIAFLEEMGIHHQTGFYI
jgi:fructose-1-phosphate kinase PfkB-like protein